jgi:hypothetical protein
VDIEQLNDIPPWEWPEDAGEMFLEILRDGRAPASKRLLAAELAGDYTAMNDALACELLLITLSASEPEELRAKAVISLGPALEDAYVNDYDDPEEVSISESLFKAITEALRKLYLDVGIPEEVRRRVLEASARAPQEWHREAVLAAYSSMDEKWKLTAVFCMRFVRGFDEQILEALDSGNPEIRYEAVTAAGHWGTPAAWPHIERLITSKGTEKSLLLAAIEAAPYIRAEDAAQIIFDLTDSDDEEIAEAALDAMGMADSLGDEMDNRDGFLN